MGQSLKQILYHHPLKSEHRGLSCKYKSFVRRACGLPCTTRFWNNLHQVRSKIEQHEPDKTKIISPGHAWDFNFWNNKFSKCQTGYVDSISKPPFQFRPIHSKLA
jgi:hypothetical protein